MKRKSVSAILILFLFFIVVPGQAWAQQAKLADLQRRVGKLEQLVGQLQREVADLQSQTQGRQQQAQPVVPKSNWHELGSWRRLQRGMTMDQVRQLLGEPERVDAEPVFIYWKWGEPVFGGSVYFGVDTNRVAGWSEPSR